MHGYPGQSYQLMKVTPNWWEFVEAHVIQHPIQYLKLRILPHSKSAPCDQPQSLFSNLSWGDSHRSNPLVQINGSFVIYNSYISRYTESGDIKYIVPNHTDKKAVARNAYKLSQEEFQLWSFFCWHCRQLWLHYLPFASAERTHGNYGSAIKSFEGDSLRSTDQNVVVCWFGPISRPGQKP